MNKLFYLFLAMCGMIACSHAQIQTEWTSRAVVPGEKTLFYILVTNGQTATVDVPNGAIKGVSLRPNNSKTRYVSMPGAVNNTALAFCFDVTADAPGTVTIPPIAVRTANGGVYYTEEQTLQVYPFSEIKWHELPQSGGQLEYGTLWHVDNKTPYINETINCEIKIYAPAPILGYDPIVIDKSGIASSGFTPLLSPDMRPTGTAIVKGQEWSVMSFSSLCHPIKSGEIKMSGMVNGVAMEGSSNPAFAQFLANRIDVPMEIPEIKLQAKDFPPGAPADFNNAVGQYRISSSTKALDLSAGDPVTVDITVAGWGTFSSLSCPGLQNASNWKLYPSTRMGDFIKSGGVITQKFQQSMRPLSETDSIPPFRLSFFNPHTEQYETATSAPIPLPWKQSSVATAPGTAESGALPPPAGIVPVDRMADIYGIVPAEVVSALPSTSSWKWCLLLYVPLLLILGLFTGKKIRLHREKTAGARQRLAEFKTIGTEGSSSEFLRRLGSFIEKRIPAESMDEALTDILKKRDTQAFLPEQSTPELSPGERKAMLDTLRKVLSKLALLPLLLCAMFLGNANAEPTAATPDAEALYSHGEYSRALDAFSQQGADQAEQAYNYYGQGNSLYRLKKPGEAALAYYRALTIKPSFIEAKRNLDFIQRKEGAILPIKDTKNEWLTFIPHFYLLPGILVSGALFLTALACLLIYKRYTIVLSIASVLFALCAATGIINLCLYPELPETICPTKLLIAKTSIQAKHSADKDSSTLVNIPASTPLILRAERGSWLYVSTFTGVPAWIERKDAEPVKQTDI